MSYDYHGIPNHKVELKPPKEDLKVWKKCEFRDQIKWDCLMIYCNDPRKSASHIYALPQKDYS